MVDGFIDGVTLTVENEIKGDVNRDILIDELIVCLTIESQRCGSRRFDRYTAGLHQAMVSTDCVTV